MTPRFSASRALLVVALTLVGGAAQAQSTLPIQWQGMDTAGTKVSSFDTTISASSPVTPASYAATALNYSYVASGESFIAYCIEPQSSNGRKNGIYTYVSSVVDTTTGTGKLLEGLYSTQFAGLSTYDQKAAFQVAVWEIMREQSGSLDATTGNFYVAAGTSSAVISMANAFLSSAITYSGSDLYRLTQLSNSSWQDLVVATPVPEPQTPLMLLAGLAAVGLIARRRLPR